MASAITDFARDLAECVEDGLELCAEVERLAGSDAAENLDLADGGEAEVFERRLARTSLDEDSAELGEGFDHENAGHERCAGKMTAEEFLVAFELPNGGGGGAGVQFSEFIDKTKGFSMWEGGKGLDKIGGEVHHAAIFMKSAQGNRQDQQVCG